MPRAKSKKSEVTRQKLMQAAHRLFREKGFEATSVREITEAANVSKGTFYLYFETKFDVLKAYCMPFINGFQSIAQTIQAADVTQYPRHIEMIIDSIIREMENNEGSMLLLHSEEISRIMAGTGVIEIFEKTFVAPVAAYIDRGVEAGLFCRVNSRLYARIIIMLCHQALESAAMYGYPGDIDEVRNVLCESIMRMLKP